MARTFRESLRSGVPWAGDVNGDGRGDVIVGDRLYDNGLIASGKAHVYHGGCFDFGTDTDSDGVGDTCDVCFGDDTSGDADLDGHCAAAVDGSVGDCDDAEPTVYPAAPELCDGLHNNCAGVAPTNEVDADADGVLACADCDDADPVSFPGATEVCDGADNACTGQLLVVESDADADGVLACAGDCNDADVHMNVTLVESCSDLLDNNCNGAVDEDGCVEVPDEGADELPVTPPNEGCGCASPVPPQGMLPLLVVALAAGRRWRA